MSMTAILLATYNGESWLDEQLASLFAQTDQDWQLHVSDDGSTDGTAGVLARWAASYPERMTVTLQPRNLGYKENFRWLLKRVEAAAYFLCDQDDVWLPEKVTLSLQALESVKAGRPGIAFTDLQVVDRGLSLLHPSLWALQRTDPDQANDLRRLLVVNVVTGCAACLNRAARDLVLEQSFEPCHDHAMALHVLRAEGVLVPVKQPLVLYRQHGANSIGARGFLDGLVGRTAVLVGEQGRVMAKRGVEWGLFRSTTDYFLYKVRLWITRLRERTHPRV